MLSPGLPWHTIGDASFCDSVLDRDTLPADGRATRVLADARPGSHEWHLMVDMIQMGTLTAAVAVKPGQLAHLLLNLHTLRNASASDRACVQQAGLRLSQKNSATQAAYATSLSSCHEPSRTYPPNISSAHDFR